MSILLFVLYHGFSILIVISWLLLSAGILLISYSDIILDLINFSNYNRYNTIFILVVITVSLIIIVYSYWYLSAINNFYSLSAIILLFVISILVLLVSSRFITLYIGWDGLGVTSYWLVCYYLNHKSDNSAIITIISNRVGDSIFMLVIAILLIHQIPYSWLSLSEFMLLILVVVTIIVFTKSAIIPFSSWLPIAIAAPTPVSALVHSSTLVTAGVLVVLRINDVQACWLGILLMCVRTVVYSSIGAIYDWDIKAIIALSTLSQVSLIFILASIRLIEYSYLHLIVHALFKSLLFIGVGIILHNFHSLQDIRIIGNVPYSLGLIVIVLRLISLVGIVFSRGYVSKDSVIELMLCNYSCILTVIMFYYCISLTVVYTIRILLISISAHYSITASRLYSYLFTLLIISILLLIVTTRTIIVRMLHSSSITLLTSTSISCLLSILLVSILPVLASSSYVAVNLSSMKTIIINLIVLLVDMMLYVTIVNTILDLLTYSSCSAFTLLLNAYTTTTITAITITCVATLIYQLH